MNYDYLTISEAQINQYRRALKVLNEVMSYKEMALQLVGVQVTDVYLQNFVKGSTGKKRRDKRIKAIIEFVDQNGGIKKLLSEPESEYADPFNVLGSIKKASSLDLTEYQAPRGLYLGIRLNPHNHSPQVVIMCLGSLENYYAFTLHYYGREKLYGTDITKQEVGGIHYAMGHNKIFISHLPHSQFLRNFSDRSHLMILNSNSTPKKSTFYMTGYTANTHTEFKLSPICFARLDSACHVQEKPKNGLNDYQGELGSFDGILKKGFSNIEGFHEEIKNHKLPINFEPLIEFMNQNTIISLSDFHERRLNQNP
ncbi:MAG: hypothetical protein DHS20C07_30070 [Methyloligella sp.]|jgi:hypothetical protein|nr:MAG: hypothetical protein DHS20C07_30070 [Methyloligella sp.]